jgi:hypothetical protein
MERLSISFFSANASATQWGRSRIQRQQQHHTATKGTKIEERSK